MKGNIQIPIEEEVSIRSRLYKNSEIEIEKIHPGGLSGAELYEALYLSASTVPNRKTDEIPTDAERVDSQRRDELIGKNIIEINVDLV